MFSRVCMTVGSSSYMTALFPVPIEVARRLVPDDYFRVAEILPDQAVFFIGTGEFRDCDIGPYMEMYVGFYTENRETKETTDRDFNLAEFSRNESKMYMWKNWVTTSAAMDKMDRAGSKVFRRGELLRSDGDDNTTFSLEHETEGSLQFSTPRESEMVQSNFNMQRTHYGRLHAEPSRCLLDLDIKRMVTSPGKGTLQLQGKIAEDCRELELPETPMVSIWIDEMSFKMNRAVLL